MIYVATLDAGGGETVVWRESGVRMIYGVLNIVSEGVEVW